MALHNRQVTGRSVSMGGHQGRAFAANTHVPRPRFWVAAFGLGFGGEQSERRYFSVPNGFDVVVLQPHSDEGFCDAHGFIGFGSENWF